MTRFLFYDIETSGLNPAFDQVLTFACIQTDMALTELSREVITVNLRPDIVPSPGAFLTHGLTPEELESGISEYQAALKIHTLFNAPNTISLGYNSLGFDDEFLRFMFYRNLLDPYSHQYAKGCSRMDLLPVTAVYRVFCDKIMSWPRLENGKSTLKLEHLSRENRFEVSGRAHEAMADVEALLSLARVFIGERKIWDYVLGFFDKKQDLGRIQGLKPVNENLQFKLGLMVSPSFGADFNYIAPVLYLGGSIPYKNQSLWLRLDRPDLFDKMDEDLGIYNLFVIRKRPADQWFVLPCLDRFWARLEPEAVAACNKNFDIIRNSDDLFSKTIAHHRGFKYPDIPDIDPDANLYQGGFFSRDEKREIALFHKADSEGKLRVCNGLASPRIKSLALRILTRNFKLPAGENPEFSTHLKGVMGNGAETEVKGYKNEGKFICVQAINELDEIEAKGMDSLNAEQKEMIVWLRSYISRLSAFLAEPL